MRMMITVSIPLLQDSLLVRYLISFDKGLQQHYNMSLLRTKDEKRNIIQFCIKFKRLNKKCHHHKADVFYVETLNNTSLKVKNSFLIFILNLIVFIFCTC